MPRSYAQFDLAEHRDRLVPLIRELRAEASLDRETYQRILRRHPPATGGAFSKSEIIRSFRALAGDEGWEEGEAFVARVRMKPIRTASGVAPVTVLTKPYPCPGKCVFCPNDVRMPKSYLSREPGAQRAAQHRFDPYGQTLGRLLTYFHNGHAIDKVELIVLGGTWSFYPEPYQIWFIKRCFDAMNDFDPAMVEALPAQLDRAAEAELSFEAVGEEVDGRAFDRTYNQVVAAYLRGNLGGRLVSEEESAAWDDLEEAHRRNEGALARCVGLVLETRPDHLPEDEVERLRRLGCTKVQIGIQSLSDRVLEVNARGHNVAATHRAMNLLRRAGFKLHAHWMPNLLGADPESDLVDFARLFDDPAVRPDELKIYPCSLIETAELMRYYSSGEWQPYGDDDLLELLVGCFRRVPPYCRVTRVIRDIPGDEIVDGNQVTNLREVAERELSRRGDRSRDIRAREIRGEPVRAEALSLEPVAYGTSAGEEVFFQFVTPDDRIVGFSRLLLPSSEAFLEEIRSSALLREVHVYGQVVGVGRHAGDAGAGRSQHLGLGRRLVAAAAERARGAGFGDLAVISAVGTRDYYRGLGFVDGALYQHLPL
ncbi:MAG: tRNA uridine(34) 5-carboxymethylaminomethyl modification radical SAM/GNAT enzyme Elp3 [Acidobacteriota bacterium]